MTAQGVTALNMEEIGQNKNSSRGGEALELVAQSCGCPITGRQAGCSFGKHALAHGRESGKVPSKPFCDSTITANNQCNISKPVKLKPCSKLLFQKIFK